MLRDSRFFDTGDRGSQQLGRERTMLVRIEAIPMDYRGERSLSPFWTGVPDYDVAVDRPGDWMILQVRDPHRTGPRLGLQVVPEPKVVKNRVHLDLVPTEGELEAEIRHLE